MKRLVTTLTAAMFVATSAAASVDTRTCFDPHLGLTYRVGATYDQLTSWYGQQHHGNLTASGEVFDMHDPSILAHKVLPLGTIVAVTNPATGQEHIARIVDDGPHVKGRALDASMALADALGFRKRGSATLTMTIISMPSEAESECRDDNKGLR